MATRKKTATKDTSSLATLEKQLHDLTAKVAKVKAQNMASIEKEYAKGKKSLDSLKKKLATAKTKAQKAAAKATSKPTAAAKKAMTSAKADWKKLSTEAKAFAEEVWNMMGSIYTCKCDRSSLAWFYVLVVFSIMNLCCSIDRNL